MQCLIGLAEAWDHVEYYTNSTCRLYRHQAAQKVSGRARTSSYRNDMTPLILWYVEDESRKRANIERCIFGD
jgi:hypothetical protein